MGTIYRNGQYYGGSPNGGVKANLERHEIGYGDNENNIVGSGLYTKNSHNIVEELCEEQSNALEFIIDQKQDGDMPAGAIIVSNGTLETEYNYSEYIKDYEGHSYIGPILHSINSGENYTIKFNFETFNQTLAEKDYFISFIGYEEFANIKMEKDIQIAEEAGVTVYTVSCIANTKDVFNGQILFSLSTGNDLAIYNGNADQDGGKIFLKDKGLLTIQNNGELFIGENNLTALDGNTTFIMHDSSIIDMSDEAKFCMNNEKVVFSNTTGDAELTIEELNNLRNGLYEEVVPYELPIATEDVLGVVKIGQGIDINDGVISVTIPEPTAPYELPVATEETLGGVKIGSGLEIDEDGTISVEFPEEQVSYELPVASEEVLGGIKIGNGLEILEDGTVNVIGGSNDDSGGGSSDGEGEAINGEIIRVLKYTGTGGVNNIQFPEKPTNIISIDGPSHDGNWLSTSSTDINADYLISHWGGATGAGTMGSIMSFDSDTNILTLTRKTHDNDECNLNVLGNEYTVYYTVPINSFKQKTTAQKVTVVKQFEYIGTGGTNYITFPEKPVSVLSMYGMALNRNYVISGPFELDSPVLILNYGGETGRGVLTAQLSYNEDTYTLTISGGTDDGANFNKLGERYTIQYLTETTIDNGIAEEQTDTLITKRFTYVGNGSDINQIQFPEKPEYIINIHGLAADEWGNTVSTPCTSINSKSMMYLYCQEGSTSTTIGSGSAKMEFDDVTNILTLTAGDYGAAVNINGGEYEVIYSVYGQSAIVGDSNINEYELPIASDEILGGIKIGEGLNITEDGTVSIEIPEEQESYELPIASEEILGGVKVGEGLTIDEDGKISILEQENDKNIDILFEEGSGIEIKTSDETYVVLDYIETTGTQQISTDIMTTGVNSHKIEIKYLMTNPNVVSDNVLITLGTNGSKSIKGSQIYAVWEMSNRLDYSMSVSSSGDSWNSIQHIKYDGALAIDTVVFTKYSESSNIIGTYSHNLGVLSNGNITLFSDCNKGWRAKAKIWYVKYYDDNVLTHEFIPVKRHSDNKIGILDKCTMTFLTNTYNDSEFIGGTSTGEVIHVSSDTQVITISNTGIIDIEPSEEKNQFIITTKDGNKAINIISDSEIPISSEETLGGVKILQSAGLEVNESGELDLKIKIVPCTKEQYEALEVKDPNTLYLIGD